MPHKALRRLSAQRLFNPESWWGAAYAHAYGEGVVRPDQQPRDGRLRYPLGLVSVRAAAPQRGGSEGAPQRRGVIGQPCKAAIVKVFGVVEALGLRHCEQLPRETRLGSAANQKHLHDDGVQRHHGFAFARPKPAYLPRSPAKMRSFELVKA